LTLHKSELFFSDKIVFIEGETERILLPAIMQKIDNDNACTIGHRPLLSQKISIVDIGAHSKIFDKFLRFLDVKSLIITDFDAVGDDRKMCRVRDGKDTSNSSIKFFLRGKTFEELRCLPEAGKVLSKETGEWTQEENGQLYIAYQTEENGNHARSFEESFFNINLDFVRSKKDDFESLKNKDRLDQNPSDYYDIAANCIDRKPSFATEILYYSDETFSTWKVPEYITKGLLWLAK
jgi:predicted ATP-dependent endonuclease of OLD family